MLSRRQFAGLAAAVWTEAAFAQRATVTGKVPPGTVWLNANEYADGPPQASIAAMTKILPETARYHFQEFPDFYAAVARSEQLAGDQVLVGAGSTEILHAAVEVFTSATRPLVLPSLTYEAPSEIAEAGGRKVIRVPLTDHYTADVKALAAAAEKSHAGMIYLCNPNNPTSTINTKAEIAWLVDNTPRGTMLLVDEAYHHFATSPDYASAMPFVRQGRDLIVARTFSKIYGMAGLRVGFGCSKPEYIQRMTPFRNQVISIVGARAVLAALDLGRPMIDERRARIAKIREDLCAWLRDRKVRYLDPQANFMMIDVRRDVRDVGREMLAKGVAVGRPFPPLDTMLRVSIGNEADMAKFRKVFPEVVS